MNRICLFCSTGMSASFVASKMQEVASKHNVPLEIKAFTDFNKKCNNPKRQVLQISTEKELVNILKSVNAENEKIALLKAEENKPIKPDIVTNEWVDPTDPNY